MSLQDTSSAIIHFVRLPWERGEQKAYASLGVPYEEDGETGRVRLTREFTVPVLPLPPAERKNREIYRQIAQAQEAGQPARREWVEALLQSNPRSVYTAQGVWLHLVSQFSGSRARPVWDRPEQKTVGLLYLSDPASRQDSEWLVHRIAKLTADAAYELDDHETVRIVAERCEKSARVGLLWRLERAKDPQWRRAEQVGRARRKLAAEREAQCLELEARLKAQHPFTPEEKKLIPSREQLAAELRRLADELKLYDSLHDPQKTFYLPEDKSTMQWKLKLDALKKIAARRAKGPPKKTPTPNPWPPEPTSPELKLWAEYMETRLKLDLPEEEQKRFIKRKKAGHPADMAHLKSLLAEMDRLHAETKGAGTTGDR